MSYDWNPRHHPELPAKLCNIDLKTNHRAWADATERVRAKLNVSSTMPKSFHGHFTVDGHKVVVFKAGESPNHKASPGSKSSAHRIFFDVGGALVPVGRIKQFCAGARRKLGLTRLHKKDRFGWERLAGLRRKRRK